MKGISACENFVILDGAIAVSSISHYHQEYKDEYGKKHKDKHAYFNVVFDGGSTVRFERDRYKLPLNKHRDISDTHTLVVYTDKTLEVVRHEVIKKIFNA